MRIVVINTAASSGGALSILKEFYNYVKDNDKTNEWIFIVSGNYIQKTENIKVIIRKDIKKNWINRLRWELKDGGKFINKLKADVVFSMQNTMCLNIKCKKVLYVHQPLPFQKTKKFSLLKREERVLAVYQYIISILINRSIKISNLIIVQTKWMKESIVNINCINSEFIKVCPPAISYKNYKKINLKSNSFFYPASSVIYKNHECIFQAIKQIKDEGYKDFNVDLTLNSINDLNKNCINLNCENIKFIGTLDRDNVFEKYKQSVLIFPSYIETYGMPLLEAKKAGTIVIASDCQFSREILNGYENAYLFNPFKPEELANYIKDIIDGKIKLKSQKGVSYEIENSWKLITDTILKIGG